MSRLLRGKQEQFCINYFVSGNASEAARLAGYAPSTRAYQILGSPNVQERLRELRERAAKASDAIMTVAERQERLSEIARANLTNFMELGADGSWVNLGSETKGSGAIQEIHSRTTYDNDGAEATVHTSVKLHDPMKAIDLLNKMDKIYSDGYQDNRRVTQYNIYVIDNEAKELIGQVGQRLISNNGHKNDQDIQGHIESVGGREEGDTP